MNIKIAFTYKKYDGLMIKHDYLSRNQLKFKSPIMRESISIKTKSTL